MAKGEEELQSSLMKVKEESEKVGLKLNIQKIKTMASGPITSRQIDRETVETVSDYFGGIQNRYRWWLQPWNSKMLAPWKKSYDQPRQHIKKAETLLYQERSLQPKLWFFQWSYMDVRVGLQRKLSTKELMLLNCGVGEDSWGSLGLQGGPTSPS